jgi:hypothetical protein
MRPRLLVCVSLVCLALAVPAAPVAEAGPPGSRVLPRRLPAPGPLDLVQLLDAVTGRDLPSSVELRQRGGRSQARLLFRTDDFDVTVSGEQANWRGTVTVKVTIPCKVGYAIDLNSLSAEVVAFGPGRLVRVRVPAAVEVVSVEPVLSRLEVEQSFGGCRFGFFDSDDALRVQNRLLREDYPEVARERASRQAADCARKQGCHELQQVLRRLFAGCDGVEVVCE